jgi:ABC-type uncharacterized transport system permease subunit
MDAKFSMRIMIALSVCYGALIGILGALNSSAVGAVAVVGAMVLGALWVVRGLFQRRDRAT